MLVWIGCGFFLREIISYMSSGDIKLKPLLKHKKKIEPLVFNSSEVPLINSLTNVPSLDIKKP